MEHAQEAIEEDWQRGKGNIERDEDITFLLVGWKITQMYHIKLQVK